MYIYFPRVSNLTCRKFIIKFKKINKYLQQILTIMIGYRWVRSEI